MIKLFQSRMKNSGQAMVEFAIAAPVLLLLLYGIIETGRLLFVYSFVNNASRQAVRYGSTNGDGPNGVPRYQDCDGIKEAAQNADFFNAFDDNDITIVYDDGATQQDTCDGSTDTGVNPGSDWRVTVTITADFNALIPRIVPFISRTVANGNPITAISSRTILGVIEVEPDLEDPVIVVSDSPDPTEPGQTVAVTVTVSGSVGTPIGLVTVTGGDTNCTDLVLSGGVASCNITFSTSGSKIIGATYSGDSNYKSGASSTGHTVSLSSTTLTITSHSPEPSQVNDDIVVSFTVVGGLTTPEGDVAVSITGSSATCTATLSSGSGSCTLSSPGFAASGAKTLSATYTPVVGSEHAGDTDTVIHNVILVNETVTYITSDNPDGSLINGNVTVAVTVAGVTTPIGTVDVTTSDGGSCQITLASGSGSCVVTFTTTGSKTIFATYNGDATHTGSSDSESHGVELPATTTVINSHTPDPSAVGTGVTVTVTVTGASTTPTGTVSITGASTNCTITLSGGTGSCNVSFDSSGTKSLAASYSGDSANAPSNSAAVDHVVTGANPIAGCDSTNIVKGFVQTSGATLTLSITNNLASQLEFSYIDVTWNHDKGALGNKPLTLNDASLGGVSFWSGSATGPNNLFTLTPSTLYLPANAITTLTFTFDSNYINKDTTEKVTFAFSTPGCEGQVWVAN